MVRRFAIGSVVLLLAVLVCGRLLLGPFWGSGEAQVFSQEVEEAEGPGVDFDGDGRVDPWERITERAWREHPSLSKVLDAALAKGQVLESGDVDISAYLQSIAQASPLERALTDSSSCSDPGWMCCFLRGDSNRDWSVNMADVITITNFLFLGGPAPPNRDAADTNDSGNLDISDATYLAAHLYSGGPAPPAPYPASGTDPTYDPVELPCQDRGDFEHDRNPLEEREIVLPPVEDPGLPKDMLPSEPTEPIDGTGGFGGISPDLPLFSAPAGLAWGFLPSYRTRYAERDDEAQTFVLETEAGKGWFTGLPHLVDAGTAATPRYWIRWSASCIRGYVEASAGVYSGRFTNQTTLIDDTATSNEFRLNDLSGKTYVFYGYDTSAGAAKGRIKRIEGLGGMTIAQVFEKPRIEFAWDLNDTGEISTASVICPLETTQTVVTSQVWTYVHAGLPDERRIESVRLERPTLPDNVKWPYEVTLRHWYPNVAEAGGTEGDLMEVDQTSALSATSDQAAPETLTRRYYYRYFTSEAWNAVSSPGYPHQVQYALGPDAAKELDASTYRTADVSTLADRAYTFCEDRRLRTLKVRGVSCGACGGQGSYTYGWSLEKPQSVAQPFESHLRMHIDLPREASVDSLRRIICFNAYGQKLVDAGVARESQGGPELSWVQGAEYGLVGEADAWFLRHVFSPSAKNTFTPASSPPCETGPAPAFNGTGSIEGYTPSLSSGKHLEYQYAWNIGESGTIGITTRLGQGKNGRAPMTALIRTIRQDTGYRKRALTRWLRQYVNDSSFQETSFNYGAGHTQDPLALGTYTKSYPMVSIDRNGSGVAATPEYFYEDSLGMLRWRKDAAARVEYREYDGVTGQVAGVVADINTSLAHPGLTPGTPPSGFASTGSDRIDAMSLHVYDALGRLSSVDSPAGVADDNTTQLRRTARTVWAKLAGPAGKTCADRLVSLSYPHVSGGTPKGGGSIQVSSPGGRTEAVAKAYLPAGTDPYFFLDHWTWGTPVERLDQVFAPANRILLERSEYAYAHDLVDDHLVVTESVWTTPESQAPNADYTVVRQHDAQGRASKVIGRLGDASFREVQATAHDALGRAVAWSVGSDELHLNIVRRVAYDGGVPGGTLTVGDGYVTQSVAYSGESSSPDRYTRYDFDWRGLNTAVWHGYDPFGQTAVLIESSPSYLTGGSSEGYDYAGQRIRESRYEGTILAANLRALSETLYDERGRVYETRSYGVEGNGTVVGTPGAPPGSPIPLSTRTWYDARGSVAKRMGPDATFRKYAYDGLGRRVKEYSGYDIAETAYGDALHVTWDFLLSQSVRTLDKAGNLLWLTTYARYPSIASTPTGDLSGGLLTTYRRREYHGYWVDILGRNEVEGFYGDNGGTAASNRPTTRPSGTNWSVRVSRNTWPETLSGGVRRWSSSTDVDGQVQGTEFDALGRVVRTWRHPASTNSYLVSDVTLDAMGHTQVHTEYQDQLTSSAGGVDPPVFSLSQASYSKTAYDWGLLRDDPASAWSDNLLGSSGLLESVRLADPSTGEPVVEPAVRYAYNLQGEVRAQIQPGSGTDSIGRSLTRDALGRTIRDDVLDGWSRGPNALEWERDSLGRLRFARSLDDSEVLNEVEYRYDAWGSVTEFRESHDGPVTPQNDPEKAPRVFQEFEGPTMVTSGPNQYPIAHRATYRRIARALESGLGYQVYAASYHDYDAAGSMTHILGRPRYEVSAMNVVPGSLWTDWTPAYRVEESYLGSRRWVKTVNQEKVAGVWINRLTQEIPSLTTTGGGLNRFGEPLQFKAWKSTSDVPLARAYAYTAATGRIASFTDTKTATTQFNVSLDSFGFDAFGRLTSYHHDPNEALGAEGGVDVNQSWGLDGAGNWNCFSGDGPCTGTPPASRTYDRRNQIASIGGDAGAVAYDTVGRIVGHNYTGHGVNASFLFDAWNRLSPYVRPLPALPVTLEYDALGNLIARGEPQDGNETHYYHDASGQRVRRGIADWAAELTYTRSSGSGRLTMLLGSTAVSTHLYVVDPFGNPVGVTTDGGDIEARSWMTGTGEPTWWGPSGNPINDLWTSEEETYEGTIGVMIGEGAECVSVKLGEPLGKGRTAVAPTDVAPKAVPECCVKPWPELRHDGQELQPTRRNENKGSTDRYVSAELRAEQRRFKEYQGLLSTSTLGPKSDDQREYEAALIKDFQTPEGKLNEEKVPKFYWWQGIIRTGYQLPPNDGTTQVVHAYLVQVNCPADGCSLDAGGCSIEQFGQVTKADDAFLKEVRAAKKNPDLKVNERFNDGPEFKTCPPNGKSPFLSMIDAPHFTYGTGTISFTTRFDSTRSSRACKYSSCEVNWTFDQSRPYTSGSGTPGGVNVTWTDMTCRDRNGGEQRKSNPKPK